jgi:hypothetical protein
VRRVADFAPTSAIYGLDIFLVGDAAYDAQLGVQPPAINGEVNIHGVVIGGQNHGRRFFQSGVR